LAVFNPQVAPTQDPNFLNYSKVVDAPASKPVIVDNSSGIALNTVATGFESAVNIVDTAIKKGISNTAYEQIDPLRDNYTSGLESLKKNLDQGIIPKPAETVVGGTTGKSLLDANASADDEDLPVGLESGLDRITQLARAKAAGSPRLNDTQYSKDVLSVAKQLRTQFAGYREYIDEVTSKASGLPVANSYYQNMLQDINRQLTQIGKTKDDVGGLMMKNLDVPGMAGYIAKRKAGDPEISDSYVLGKIGEWQNLQTQQKIDAAKRAEKSDKKTDNIADQDQRLIKTLGDTVTMEMSAVKDLGGVGTPKQLLEYFDNVAAGKIPSSDAEVQQKKLMFNSWVTQVERRLADKSTGYAEVVGSDTAEKRIKAAMYPIYTMQKFINSKEDGPAFFHSQQIEAIKNDAGYNWLNNKDTAALSQQLLGARHIFGEQYFPDFMRSILESGQDKKFKNVFSEEALNAANPITDTRGQPIPRYMKDAILHGKKIGATGEDEYYGSVVGLVGTIADPKAPLAAKDRMIDWAFNPKNIGRLDELKMDYRDPKTGEMVPGKYRAFNILSSPSVVQGVKETSLVKPENYQKFQSTLEQEFGKLYRSDVVTLNKVVEGRTVPTGPDGNPVSGPLMTNVPVTNKKVQDMHFSFNNETNQFGIVDNNNRPITRDTVGVKDRDKLVTLDVLDRVNGGLTNLANVQKNAPQGAKDTSQYLLQTLQTIGFRPGERISGATEGMMKAVIKAHAPDMTNEDLNKKIFGSPGGVTPTAVPFTAEEDRSLSAFLRSPAGQARGNIPASRGVIKGNLSDEQLVGIQTDDIPAGMDAREFIRQLKAGKKFGGSAQ
jgi:hypothetical protein